jgi:peptidase M23-like protein
LERWRRNPGQSWLKIPTSCVASRRPIIAVRGPANSSAHRTAITVLEGAPRAPQRFAVDWLALDNDGQAFTGDPSRNASWYGYGKPVRSATAGRVARVVDGAPDNQPLAPPAPDSFDANTVAGNLVVVDAGDGRFLVYAHLQKGSIAVHEGQRIEVGASIGRIGNCVISDN